MQEFGRHLLALTLGMWTPDYFPARSENTIMLIKNADFLLVSITVLLSGMNLVTYQLMDMHLLMTVNCFSAVFYIHILVTYFIGLWCFEIYFLYSLV